MTLLTSIAQSATVPSTKFVGRPARPCSKCKGAWHWVNQMGGISCVSCQPAPASVIDLESRFLVADMGKWEQPDGFLHTTPDAAIKEPQGNPAQSHSHIAPEPDSQLLDVFQDIASIHVLPIKREWSIEDQQLASWWLALTAPGTAALTATTSRLQGQRLSRWCVVQDAGLMIEQLRMDCVSGVDSPRELHGCLLVELREVKAWLGGQIETNAVESVLGDENDIEFDLSGIEL